MQVNQPPIEVLVFTLGGEECGIEIHNFQELCGYEAVPRIANTPDYIKGVVSLRGITVPIIDMRLKFNLGPPVYDQFTAVIILNPGKRVLGMVVDDVLSVLPVSVEQMQPPPKNGSVLQTGYLTGVATIGQRTLNLLDIDKVMASVDIDLVFRLAA